MTKLKSVSKERKDLQNNLWKKQMDTKSTIEEESKTTEKIKFAEGIGNASKNVFAFDNEPEYQFYSFNPRMISDDIHPKPYLRKLRPRVEETKTFTVVKDKKRRKSRSVGKFAVQAKFEFKPKVRNSKSKKHAKSEDKENISNVSPCSSLGSFGMKSDIEEEENEDH